MRNKAVFVVFICGVLLCPGKGFAAPFDSASLLKAYEDSMKSLQFVRINAYGDQEKDDANARLFALMNKALQLSGSFEYPFDSLTTIGKVTSSDKQIRVITWDVPKSGSKFEYFGFIQSYNPHKKKYELFVLKDHTDDIPNIWTTTCTPEKWLGMLYYKIIKEKGSKNYILLAWEGWNKLITRKIIDILSLNAQGIPTFGKAVFGDLPSTYKGSPKRLIFEYSAQVFMSLEYDEPKNMILFDLLGPAEEGLTGQHQYYGPSFQVDGLAYNSGTWNYVANVQVRNPNSKEDKLFNDPKNPSYQLKKQAIYSPK